MKSFIVWFMLFLVISNPIQAELPLEIYKNKIKVFITKLIGEKYSSLLFGKRMEAYDKEENEEGEEDIKISLPNIPTIEDKAIAKSTADGITMTSPDDAIMKGSSEEINRYSYLFIEDLFRAVKKRTVREEEIATWMNVLTQGGTREGVYRALVLDSEYRNLEQIPGAVSKELVEFTKFFFGKYLNIEIGDDALTNFNGYTVKRITTENALEVMDLMYAQDREGFFNWYAILSDDLATKYGEQLQGDIRKKRLKKIHKIWAQAVPLQHVKSEVIIKLHQIYNAIL